MNANKQSNQVKQTNKRAVIISQPNQTQQTKSHTQSDKNLCALAGFAFQSHASEVTSSLMNKTRPRHSMSADQSLKFDTDGYSGTVTAQQIEFIEADAEYLQLNESEGTIEGVEVDAEGGDEGDENWEPASIRQLLSLYLQHVDKFRNPKVRKKNIWIEIAALVGKSPDGCDKKFRNLKQTYIRLLKKKKRTGHATFKWPYFDTFEEIYLSDGHYHPEIELKMSQESGDAGLAAGKCEPDEPMAEAWERPNARVARLEDQRRRISRKRYADFRGITVEMRERQRAVENKLDRLVAVVEESNSIQRERNKLFQRFLEKMSHNV